MRAFDCMPSYLSYLSALQAQFAAGLLSLGLQLHALGISEGPGLDPDSSLVGGD